MKVHFPSIVLEGVYTMPKEDGAGVFHPFRAPTTEEVASIAGKVALALLIPPRRGHIVL